MTATMPEAVAVQRLMPRRRFDWLETPEGHSRFENPWREKTMRVEQYEEGDEVVVKVEIPGLDPDKDVEIEVVDERLRIRAERHREPEVEEKGHYGSEFHYGTFSRILPLPTGATAADVKTYKAGILEVRVLIDRNAAEARKAPSTAPDRSAIAAERAGWSGSAPTHPESLRSARSTPVGRAGPAR